MADNPKDATHQRWARLRFSVVGPLLASPPARGELQAELVRLAKKIWLHPVTQKPLRVGESTIERWYYQAKAARGDPVSVLRRRVRKDLGQRRAMNTKLEAALMAQYGAHPRWSYQLHADNLRALVAQDPKELGPMPSYATVRRTMKALGLYRRRRLTSKTTAGAEAAEKRLDEREVRSFEAEYVHGLWHLDFHQGSKKVLLPEGRFATPFCLCVLDDRSRLCCHLQWYLAETAENLVHGLIQAILKRGLPRALLTDNGSAMVASEVREGLLRLGVTHETTLPHSPYQNAKQEVFWAQLEGRLLAMLEGVTDLDLRRLNETTLAWVEMEYQKKPHSEIGQSPLDRFCDGPSVGRDSPSTETLRLAFTTETVRTQRKSDGTLSLEGVRFEVPSRYRHLERLSIRYAAWDLTLVQLVDGHTGTVLARLYPLDKTKNADGVRRTLEPTARGAAPEVGAAASGMAPLLSKLLADWAATGLPPPYLPMDETKNPEDT